MRRTRLGGLVVLGDSVSSGDGVGLVTPLERTWGALLTRALGEQFTSVAACGGTSARVRAHQLASALAARPRVAAVLTGLNDVIKTPCEPARCAPTSPR